jgi:hypothetical protein
MGTQDLKTALDIYQELYLSPYGYMEYSTDTASYFEEIQNYEVYEMLELVTHQFGFEILIVNHGVAKETKRIYLVPTQECKFAYTSADIKRYFGAAADRRCDYLAMYLLLLLTNQFYSGTPIVKVMTFITVNDFLSVIEEAIQRQNALPLEKIMSVEYNIHKACQAWEALTGEDNLSTTSKLGFLRKTIALAKHHDLFYEESNEEDSLIYATPKMDALVTHAKLYLSDRMKDILELDSEMEGEEYAGNQQNEMD